jgi:hypothetical protein
MIVVLLLNQRTKRRGEMTIKIVTDSKCDMPEKVIQELGITVVPLFINLFDKRN